MQSSLPAEAAAPHGTECRMMLRLLFHLRRGCGDNQFPFFTDVNPAQMAEIWGYCFFPDFVGHEDHPVVQTVGDRLPMLADMKALESKRINVANGRSIRFFMNAIFCFSKRNGWIKATVIKEFVLSKKISPKPSKKRRRDRFSRQ